METLTTLEEEEVRLTVERPGLMNLTLNSLKEVKKETQ